MQERHFCYRLFLRLESRVRPVRSERTDAIETRVPASRKGKPYSARSSHELHHDLGPMPPLAKQLLLNSGERYSNMSGQFPPAVNRFRKRYP
jgi:hypothetical protein